ncbi:NrfD/PsrC family molybdoenzyme membrane anchor subunit [Chloroflexota bacterium]
MEEPGEEALLRSVFQPSRRIYLLTAILLAIIAWAIVAYVYQMRQGLGVTGLNRPVFWGLYLINFVFFIGISHAGTLVSAILRITGAEWRRPITRAAEAITVFSLMLGVGSIMIDLGRIDRIWALIRYPRLQSPLLWDVSSVSVYLTCSIIYLYLPLIPDVALLRDRTAGARGARHWLYSKLALGWSGSQRQWHRLERAISIMAVLIIPVAVSVHTVVSWIFAMTLQPTWHSTIFGPYFVVGAIFSGIATLIIVMAIIRKAYGLEAYLKPLHFNNLGLLLLTMCLFWFYFTFAEYLTEFYGAEPAPLSVLMSKLQGEFSPAFFTMTFFCFVVPFVILAFPRTRTIAGTVVASVLIDIGMWLERYTIVVPALTRPRLPYEFGVYIPTLVEWSITLGCLAAFVLMYVIFARIFPIISIWEVQEEDPSTAPVTEEQAAVETAT